MLPWALVFVVLAILGAALGMGGLAGTSSGIVQILLIVFVAFLAISVLANAVRRVR